MSHARAIKVFGELLREARYLSRAHELRKRSPESCRIRVELDRLRGIDAQARHEYNERVALLCYRVKGKPPVVGLLGVRSYLSRLRRQLD